MKIWHRHPGKIAACVFGLRHELCLALPGEKDVLELPPGSCLADARVQELLKDSSTLALFVFFFWGGEEFWRTYSLKA